MSDDVHFTADPNNGPKLTEWKNEPTLLELKRDYDVARIPQAAVVAKINEWNDIREVTGDAAPKKIDGRSSVQPKLVRRQAEWRYSALTEPFLSSQNVFKVEPATWNDVQAAKQNQIVLNWQFRTQLNRVKFIDDLVRSTHDDGTCIIQAGWRRVTVPVKQEVPVWEHYAIDHPDQAQMFQQALQLKQENPKQFNEQCDPSLKASIDFYEESGQTTVAVQKGTQTVTVDKVVENQPTLMIHNPRNVFIDPSCLGDIRKAMYAIISFETCHADLKKEGKKYKNLDQVMWSANTPATEPNHYTTTPMDFAVQDHLRRKVVAYEYWGKWDINGDGVLVPIVATWIGNVLIRMEKNPFPDEAIPLVVIPYLPKKRELYGETDAELLGDHQKILGALFRGMIDLLGRSANGQQGMAKGMLDPLNKRKYDKGQDYEFNPNMNPQQGIIEHKYPEMPQSALMMSQMVNQEAEALTGVKSFSGGMSGEAYGEVAAGIRGMLDAASKREMAILRRLAKGMTEIGQKIIAMNSIFLSEEEVVAVTSEQFVTIKREDLKGNFNLVVDISTAEVDNAKATDMAFMLQTIGPNTDPSIMLMIMADIADLKRMPELAHKLRTFKPQPSPEQQMLQQLALQKAQLEVAKLQAEIAHIQAKTALDGAKAEHEGSKKDKLDLDYVEQETGTQHVRDMAKLEAQARGNQDLEITKALVTPKKREESKPDIKAAVGYNQLSQTLHNLHDSKVHLPLGSIAGS